MDPIPVIDALRSISDRRSGSSQISIPECAHGLEASCGLEAISHVSPAACGFEIRLDHDDTVDLGILLTPGAGRDELTGSHGSPIAELAERSPAWQRLSRLCDDWARPGSHSHHRIQQMFLEFDAAELEASTSPVPSVFLSIHSEFGWQVVDDTNTNDWLLDEALPILHGAALPDSMRRDVRRCIDALPDAGRLLHVAVMLGRTPMALRLFIALPVETLRDTLAACGWPGDPAELESLHARYGDSAGFAQIQLDLYEGVRGRIGLEFSPRAEGWHKLLDRLIDDGLCLPRKCTALLDWPRRFREPLAPGGWPCTFERELSHVKLVYQPARPAEPAQPLQAKAYVTLTAGHELGLGAALG